MTTQTPGRITVGVRELHNRTSELMRAVSEGAELEVTNHGKAVARVTAVDEDSPYERLMRAGMIREPKRRDDWNPKPRKLKSGATVSDLIKEQRR